MHWPKRRCLARHLRRAALVSLITASSNGLSFADQPQASVAPVQHNQFATPTRSHDVRGQVSEPRIVVTNAVGGMHSGPVQLIDSQVQLNPLAIRQTAAPEAKPADQAKPAAEAKPVEKTPAVVNKPLAFRNPRTAVDSPGMLVEVPQRSTLTLRSNAPLATEQPIVGVGRSVLTIAPQRSLASGAESDGISCSISDDSLSLPAFPLETTPVELVRSSPAAIVDVVAAPRSIEAPVVATPVVATPVVATPEAIKPADKQPEAKVATTESVPATTRWKMPTIRPLMAADRSETAAEEVAAGQPPLARVAAKEPAADVEKTKSILKRAPVAIAPLPLAQQDGQARVKGMLEEVPPRKNAVVSTPSKRLAKPADELPTIVKESKVVLDVPPPTSVRPSQPAASGAVVAIKSTMDPTADLVTRSAFTVSIAESRVLFAGDRIVRVSVEHPEVCNAVTTSRESVLVVGRKSGRTRVAIWTDSTPNLEPDLYEVQVDGEQGESADQKLAGKMTATVMSMFADAQVKVQAVEDGFVVSGVAETESQARKILQVVRAACLRRVVDEIVVR